MACVLILLIAALEFMLAVNCLMVGFAYLLPRRELPHYCTRSIVCLMLTRLMAVALVLLGLSLIYALCAPFAQWWGHRFFRRILLM